MPASTIKDMHTQLNFEAESAIFTRIGELPLHPLVVHFAVVLLPLAAVMLIAAAFVPMLRRRFLGLSTLLTVVGSGATLLAKESGEALAEVVGEPEAHAEWADAYTAAAAVFTVLAVIWWFLGRWTEGRSFLDRSFMGRSLKGRLAGRGSAGGAGAAVSSGGEGASSADGRVRAAGADGRVRAAGAAGRVSAAGADGRESAAGQESTAGGAVDGVSAADAGRNEDTIGAEVSPRQSRIAVILGFVTALAGIAVIVLAILTGHSGAQETWSGTLALAVRG